MIKTGRRLHMLELVVLLMLALNLLPVNLAHEPLFRLWTQDIGGPSLSIIAMNRSRFGTISNIWWGVNSLLGSLLDGRHFDENCSWWIQPRCPNWVYLTVPRRCLMMWKTKLRGTPTSIISYTRLSVALHILYPNAPPWDKRPWCVSGCYTTSKGRSIIDDAERACLRNRVRLSFEMVEIDWCI